MLPILYFQTFVLLSGLLTGKMCGQPVKVNGGYASVMLISGASPINIFDLEVRIERLVDLGWKTVDLTFLAHPDWRKPIAVQSRAWIEPGEIRACVAFGQSHVATSIIFKEGHEP